MSIIMAIGCLICVEIINNLFILNGRLGQDRGIGRLTFRNASVIYYMLATAPKNLLILKFWKLTQFLAMDIANFLLPSQ